MAWRVQPGLQEPAWAALLALEQGRKLLTQVQALVLVSQVSELGPGQEPGLGLQPESEQAMSGLEVA